ncbi:MAG: ABC transporter ATP-binding protein [Planctomycetes bacterium]|nr:ABC transporter ATP-binding protein [Planctomycetota bacterium]
MIEISRLTKAYGRSKAVDHLDLKIREGELFGFIGPNGAGKTTTLKILATLLQPTFGQAWVNGYNVRREGHGVRRSIGYMPDFFGIYDEMKVWEYLDFFGAAHGVAGSERPRVIGDVLELTDLGGQRDSLVHTLSRGMQQRLGLARVLIHDPKVLLLDEPASGLDPRARIEFKALLRELRSMGKTILLSSHILSDLNEMCTQVGIIERGRLLYSGPLDGLTRRVQPARRLRVRVQGEPARARQVLLETGAASVSEEDGNLVAEIPEEAGGLALFSTALFRAGLAITRFEEETPRLEEIFLQVTHGVEGDQGTGDT